MSSGEGVTRAAPATESRAGGRRRLWRSHTRDGGACGGMRRCMGDGDRGTGYTGRAVGSNRYVRGETANTSGEASL